MFRRTRLPAAVLALALPLAACSGGDEAVTPASGDLRSSTAPSETATQRTLEAKPEPEPERSAGEQSRPEPAPALAHAMRHGPARAKTPARLARQIRAAEEAIADERTAKDVLAAAGHLQQVAYRVLGTRPGWDERVLRALPKRLHKVVRANVASRREFRSMHHHLSDTLPAWRIIDPAPADKLLEYYRLAEKRFGVDWEYLAAINLVETGMGRIRGTSVAGAQGPMQFMPGTWDMYGKGDVNSPRDAILAAGRFLRAHDFTERGGVPGALYRYNNSMRYVRGVTHLAKTMERRPRAFHGYYHWEIYYLSKHGDVRLPVGYEETEPVPVKRWLRRNSRT